MSEEGRRALSGDSCPVRLSSRALGGSASSENLGHDPLLLSAFRPNEVAQRLLTVISLLYFSASSQKM